MHRGGTHRGIRHGEPHAAVGTKSGGGLVLLATTVAGHSFPCDYYSIYADLPQAALRTACCVQLDQRKSRLYAAKALSAERLQHSAVVAYSRDFGLSPGQLLNSAPAGKSIVNERAL
eukprot:COSAG01_NODE_4057_length_5389_cov_15.480340_8_plen_117_part_00